MKTPEERGLEGNFNIKVEDAKAAVLVSRGKATVLLPSLLPLVLGAVLSLYLADHKGLWGLVGRATLSSAGGKLPRWTS